MCVEWFRDKYLAIAMAFTVSISRLVITNFYLILVIHTQGSVLAFSTEAAIGNYFGNYEIALWIGIII